MIKIENTEVVGWEAAIRGMRNPMSSWDRSDSYYCDVACGSMEIGDTHRRKCPYGFTDEQEDMYGQGCYVIGQNDRDLMKRLAANGPVHAKYRRMIVVYADITAPLYWLKEADTYKVGTVSNSCSTMHKVTAKKFTLDDFSHDHLLKPAIDTLNVTIEALNEHRDIYLNGGMIDNGDGTARVFEPKDKDIWWQIIQLLPSSYNQRRTYMLNYEVLANIYQYRRNHKLTEWRTLCAWIETLPESWIITGKEAENECTISPERK